MWPGVWRQLRCWPPHPSIACWPAQRARWLRRLLPYMLDPDMVGWYSAPLPPSSPAHPSQLHAAAPRAAWSWWLAISPSPTAVSRTSTTTASRPTRPTLWPSSTTCECEGGAAGALFALMLALLEPVLSCGGALRPARCSLCWPWCSLAVVHQEAAAGVEALPMPPRPP